LGSDTGVFTNSALDTFRIGGQKSSGSDVNPFNGLIDDVRVYNRALSADEIKRLYKMGGTLTVNKTITNNSLTSGLVGHWTFDGSDMGTTSVMDRSGTTTVGWLINSPRKVFGKIGQALEFDSTNYVKFNTISSGEQTTNSFSVTFWAKSDNWNTSITAMVAHKPVCSNNTAAGWAINYRKNEVDACMSDASGNGVVWTDTDSGKTLVNGQWHFFSMVVDRSRQIGTVTVDTELPTSKDVSAVGSLLRLNTFLTFGGIALAPDCACTLDDIRIYDRAITNDELKRLYKMGGTLTVNKTVSNNSLASGLVGHWTFDGPDMGTTSAMDRSGNNNLGWLMNLPQKVFGQIGQGIEFNGTTNYVVAPYSSSIAGLSNVTYTAWIAPGLNEVKGILGGLNGEEGSAFNYIRIDNNGTEVNNPEIQATFNIGGVTNTRTAQIASRTYEWLHIAYSYDGSFEKIYMNGVLQTTVTNSGALASNTERGIIIGTNLVNGGVYFRGKIDDVRIYNRALSDDEVKRLYNMGR